MRYRIPAENSSIFAEELSAFYQLLWFNFLCLQTRFLNADSVSGELNFSIDPRSSVVKVFLKNSPDSVGEIFML